MRDENYPHTFLDDLFSFLDDMIDLGTEVHIVDHSDPDHVTEHVFNADEEPDEEVPFGDEPTDCDAENCDECPFACEFDLDSELAVEEDEPDMWGIPDIERIVFSDPATIVFWEDGTKTVVKCMKGERFERYAGFAAACMKKLFGSTSRAKSIMNDLAVEQVKVEKKKDVPLVNPDVHDETIREAVDEALG